MVVSIRSLETVVPATSLPQPEVGDLFLTQPGLSRLTSRMIRAVFDASAIETRHTVLAELGRAGAASAGFLFVLRDLLTRAGHAPERVAALAFGPGLAVEAATLTLRTQA